MTAEAPKNKAKKFKEIDLIGEAKRYANNVFDFLNREGRRKEMKRRFKFLKKIEKFTER